MQDFQERVLGGGEPVAPRPPENWWGISESAWFAAEGLRAEDFAGYYRESEDGKSLLCNEWKALDEAEAAERAAEMGNNAGWIELDVFTTQEAGAGSDDGLVISTRSMTKKKPATLRQLREQLAKVEQYLGKNRHRMEYPEYEAQGWQIGSGVVESACKTVVGQRLKGAGMRWSEAGAHALCPVRALYRSEKGQWAAFWSRNMTKTKVYQLN